MGVGLPVCGGFAQTLQGNRKRRLSNINTLIKFDCGESGMGASYKSMLCKVYPVKEEEM